MKPPRSGSFQSALLLELDTRERNLRLAEVTLLLRVLQIGLDVPEETITRFLTLYESELFQDLYVPETQQRLREDLRRKREEVAAKAQAHADALKRVAKFEDRPGPPPGIRNGT